MKRSPDRVRPDRSALPWVLALLALGVIVRVVDLPVPVRTPDEDAYADFYATPLAEHGFGELPHLVHDYNSRPEMYQFPPPTRVGYLAALAGAMALSGHLTLDTAAWVSALASGLLLALVAVIGWRHVQPWAAVIALGLTAFSPLDRAMARRVWGDELLALCAIGALLAWLEFRARRVPSWRVVAFALAGYSILIKESGVLLLALVTVACAIESRRARGWRAAATELAFGGATLALAFGASAALCGGVGPLGRALAHTAAAVRSNAYVREYQHGGADYYLRGWARMRPIPIALGFASALWMLARRGRAAAGAWRAGAAEAGFAFAVLAIVFVAAASAWEQKNLRFASPIYAPLDLLAGMLVWAGLERARDALPPAGRRTAVAVVALLLAGVVALDQWRFVEFFLRRGIPDLATPWFTRGG